ncbi:hypothetical protein KIW84_015164 [Lathyrus oleraceus]|uniref:Uncharacterized protein n=1 Tax=Pisum sativum TaxID=3888 RepID=A0A9D5BPJ4_PEA|nr:hypothetical protein KIW84_015164 [Pisum sativum]
MHCPMVSTQIGEIYCPLWELHCCPDGKDESKGISHMVSHFKMIYLWSDEHKNIIQEAIESYSNSFTTFKETLKEVGQWICGRCMRIHAMGHACHHSDGLVRVTLGTMEVGSHIMGGQASE